MTDPGMYDWVVSFSGDQFNDGSSTDCGAEVTTITATEDREVLANLMM
ncbi:MAG: hypothetical protein WCA30_18925 [Dermatophilaceae bacterium]